MRNLPLLLLILILSLPSCSPFRGAPATEAQRDSEAAQLVRLSLTDRLLANARQDARQRFGALMIARSVDPNRVEHVFDLAYRQALDAEEPNLLDTLVPIYRRYYTPEEIHQLLSFYQSDVAHKAAGISARISAEIGQPVRLWNEHFEEQLLEKIEDRLRTERVRKSN